MAAATGAGAPLTSEARQSDYITRGQAAIERGSEILASVKAEGKPLTDGFFLILESLAKARGEIAVAHETKDALLFGRSRGHVLEDVAYTLLAEKGGVGAQYKPYGDRMLAFLQTVIKGSIPLQGNPSQKSFRIDSKEGRHCSFELELLTSQDLRDREWDREVHSRDEEMRAYCLEKRMPDYSRIGAIDFPSSKEDLALAKRLHDETKEVKQKFPEVYTHSKMHFILQGLNQAFPVPKKINKPDGTPSHVEGDGANLKSIYILGKVRIEIGGKLYALSQYLTWTYQDHASCPVKRLSRSSVWIIHQDKLLTDDVLRETASIFQQALQWERATGDLQALKDQVALIRYLFAHAMPYRRGSAAIGEWLEEVIYRDRGVAFRRVEGKSGDLEAFIAPLWPTFKAVYGSTIELT